MAESSPYLVNLETGMNFVISVQPRPTARCQRDQDQTVCSEPGCSNSWHKSIRISCRGRHLATGADGLHANPYEYTQIVDSWTRKRRGLAPQVGLEPTGLRLTGSESISYVDVDGCLH